MKLLQVGYQFVNLEKITHWQWSENYQLTGQFANGQVNFDGHKARDLKTWLDKHFTDTAQKPFDLLKWLLGVKQPRTAIRKPIPTPHINGLLIGERYVSVENVTVWDWQSNWHGTQLSGTFEGGGQVKFIDDQAKDVKAWLDKNSEFICEEYQLDLLLKLLKLLMRLLRKQAQTVMIDEQANPTAKIGV